MSLENVGGRDTEKISKENSRISGEYQPNRENSPKGRYII